MEMCKTLLGFAHFHRHGWHELKTTKPDRSFATNTGHFHLLLTSLDAHVPRFCHDWQSANYPSTPACYAEEAKPDL
jgi:hypothetical protein